MSGEKPQIVFALGRPGAGKSTQCPWIEKEFGYKHLCAGDLLRDEKKKAESAYREEIECHFRNNTIVPIEITLKLIDIAMEEDGGGKFVIDGFPRNKDNLDGWNKNMSDRVHLLFVLFFHCDEKVCVDRCLKRGEEGSRRADDNLEILKKRMIMHNTAEMPIIEHYTHMGLVKKIDASRSPDQVNDEVRGLFEEADSQQQQQ